MAKRLRLRPRPQQREMLAPNSAFDRPQFKQLTESLSDRTVQSTLSADVLWRLSWAVNMSTASFRLGARRATASLRYDTPRVIEAIYVSVMDAPADAVVLVEAVSLDGGRALVGGAVFQTPQNLRIELQGVASEIAVSASVQAAFPVRLTASLCPRSGRTRRVPLLPKLAVQATTRRTT